MSKIEIKTFNVEKDIELAKEFLKNSLPEFKGIFQLSSLPLEKSDKLLNYFKVAKIISECENIPEKLKEISLIGFCVSRGNASNCSEIFIVATERSHGGLWLDPEELLEKSKTGGEIYGELWYKKFYAQYEVPIHGKSITHNFGGLSPSEEILLADFDRSFNELFQSGPVLAMNNIERIFAI